MKPPTPLPTVTVIHRDCLPEYVTAPVPDPEDDQKKWFNLQVRINDRTRRRIAVMQQFQPGKTQSQIIREALDAFFSRGYR